MAVVSDYTTVLDGSTTIGDGQVNWEMTFNTGGRRTSGTALLSLMVRGLTHASNAVPVRVNDTVVGHITPNRYPTEADRAVVSDHWFAQYFAFPANVLNDGNNEIRVEAAPFPEATPANNFDDFTIRDVVCHFKQDVP